MTDEIIAAIQAEIEAAQRRCAQINRELGGLNIDQLDRDLISIMASLCGRIQGLNTALALIKGPHALRVHELEY